MLAPNLSESWPKEHQSAHDGEVDTVGKRVRYRRQQLGIGVRELGRIIGKDGSYVARLERTDRQPRAGTVDTLASALRCRVAWLVNGELPIEALDDDIPPDERYPNREKAIEMMADVWPPELVQSLRTIVLWSDHDPSPSAWVQQGEQLRRLLGDL